MTNAVEKFRALREREEEIFGGAQPTRFPRPQWFLQPYLPGLIYLGELRAFFVNGILYNSFSTTPLDKNPTKMQVAPVWVARPSDLFM
jgi:hypothetical protein